MSAPVAYWTDGLCPSNPHWKGTTNFLCSIAEPESVNSSVCPAKLVATAVAPSEPNIFSSENATLLPCAAVDGIGDKYSRLSKSE